MAKKQTFGEKVGKQKASSKNHIKLIRSGKSKKTNALRFYEEMVKIPDGKNADSVVKEILSK
tara:strand:+ start:374 stop:559 length:186 start_codon:yes stop_codon:yes gene_type:complete